MPMSDVIGLTPAQCFALELKAEQAQLIRKAKGQLWFISAIAARFAAWLAAWSKPFAGWNSQLTQRRGF